MAPAALSLLTVTFTEAKERARAFGVYGAIAGGGSAVGLLLGGVLTEYASWRWTLLVSTPIAILAALAATRVRQREPGRGQHQVRPPRRATSTARPGRPGLRLHQGQHATAGARRPPSSLLAAGVVLLVAFVVIELRSTHPLLPMRVLLDRNRGGSFLIAC